MQFYTESLLQDGLTCQGLTAKQCYCYPGPRDIRFPTAGPGHQLAEGEFALLLRGTLAGLAGLHAATQAEADALSSGEKTRQLSRRPLTESTVRTPSSLRSSLPST